MYSLLHVASFTFTQIQTLRAAALIVLQAHDNGWRQGTIGRLCQRARRAACLAPFAWLGNFRRLVVRYERSALNYLGFVQLGCILILLRQSV